MKDLTLSVSGDQVAQISIRSFDASAAFDSKVALAILQRNKSGFECRSPNSIATRKTLLREQLLLFDEIHLFRTVRLTKSSLGFFD